MDSEALLHSIRNRAAIDDHGQVGYTATDLLNYANSEMHYELLPWMRQVREEYLVVSELIPLGSKAHYEINPRAIAIRDVLYRPSLTGGRVRLGLYTRDQVADDFYQARSISQPAGFYLENNHIVLLPDTGTSFAGFLEVPFLFRPGNLVEVSGVRKVQNVSNKTVTLTEAIPSGWTASTRFDVHGPNSSAHIKVWNAPVVTASGTTLIFTNNIDGSDFGTHAVAAGDYVCLTGEAAVPGLPVELHAVLAQATACRVLESLGDINNLQASTAELERMKNNVIPLINNRVEGRAKVIKNHGLIFSPGSYYNRGWL
jgi:hypothetical protein